MSALDFTPLSIVILNFIFLMQLFIHQQNIYSYSSLVSITHQALPIFLFKRGIEVIIP